MLKFFEPSPPDIPHLAKALKIKESDLQTTWFLWGRLSIVFNSKFKNHKHIKNFSQEFDKNGIAHCYMFGKHMTSPTLYISDYSYCSLVKWVNDQNVISQQQHVSLGGVKLGSG